MVEVHHGDWVRYPDNDLAHILSEPGPDRLGRDISNYCLKQWFDPVIGCPNGCLEGDGGSGGGISEGAVVIPEPPYVYCDHCGEEGYQLLGETRACAVPDNGERCGVQTAVMCPGPCGFFACEAHMQDDLCEWCRTSDLGKELRRDRSLRLALMYDHWEVWYQPTGQTEYVKEPNRKFALDHLAENFRKANYDLERSEVRGVKNE